MKGDGIASSLGLVRRNKSKTRNHITKSPYTKSVKGERTQHCAETRAPPSQEPRDHTARRPQGYEIGAKQYDKERTLFWSSKRKKKQARKNGPSQFKIPAAAVGQINFNLKQTPQQICHNEGAKKGPKLDPPGGTTFDFKRVHFLTLFETRFLCTEVQKWTLSRLNPVPP